MKTIGSDVTLQNKMLIVQLLQFSGLLKYPIDEKLIYGISLLIVIPFVAESYGR